MALSLLSREVSDLCIGKPALRWLPLSATVADALSALRRSGKNWISIWNCEHYAGRNGGGVSVGDCRCVGKVCLADVVCFLCREDNLVRPLIALESPVSVLIRKAPELVKHLEPNSSKLLLGSLSCDVVSGSLTCPGTSQNVRGLLRMSGRMTCPGTSQNVREADMSGDLSEGPGTSQKDREDDVSGDYFKGSMSKRTWTRTLEPRCRIYTHACLPRGQVAELVGQVTELVGGLQSQLGDCRAGTPSVGLARRLQVWHAVRRASAPFAG